MSAPAPVPRLHRARHRMRLWLVALAALAVVALGVTAVAGGFGDHRVQKLALSQSGTPVDAGEVTVEFEDARIESTGPAIRFPIEGSRWLVVDAVLENHTDAPVSASTVSVLVRGATFDFDQRPRSTVRLADSNDAGDLQPDLPTRIAWVWPLESGAVIPDGRLDVALIAQPRKLGDPVYDDASYDPFELIARLELDLRGGS